MVETESVVEVLCPVEDEARVVEIDVELRAMRGADALRQLLARLLVRVNALEERLKVGTGESRRLRTVDWLERRSDASLLFRVPGSAKQHRMMLGFLRASYVCALCGTDLNPGMQAYHAGWRTSAWLRNLRICYECGQKIAPAPKSEDLL